MEPQKTSQNFLPDFCAVRAVLVLMVSAQIFAVVLTLAGNPSRGEFLSELSIPSLYVQWIVLVSAGMICLLRLLFKDMGHATAGVMAWLLIMLVAWLAVELAWWSPLGNMVSDSSKQGLLLRTLGISGIAGAALLRYLYENYQQRQQALAETCARLHALQARIRPHFLFNSINTVISLISLDARKAEDTLQDLSDLFRASLADEDSTSTLGQELSLVRQYLGIEQQRLGDRLTVQWDIQDLPEKVSMPGLILQPLAENAVVHGIEPAADGGEIRVYGRYRKGVLALAVSNSLPEENEDKVRTGNSMALDNIRQRLALRYGDAAGLSTGMVDKDAHKRMYFTGTKYFQARIHFPATKEKR